jgi:hypothetical protein
VDGEDDQLAGLRVAVDSDALAEHFCPRRSGAILNDWAAMCGAVVAMKVERRRDAQLICLPLAVGASDDDGIENEPDNEGGYGPVMASTGTEAKSPRFLGGLERDGRDSKQYADRRCRDISRSFGT